MAPEIEATFVNIDKDEYRARLERAGAKLVQAELLMKRTVFDVDEHSFVRVRDEGNKITMSYKRFDSATLSGMKEICLAIDNYDNAVDFVKACGLKPKSQQESYREEWELEGVEITIDTWPWLPTYTEIEGKSEESVKSVAAKLGFDMKDAIYGSACDVYQIYYDVTEHEINYCPEIKFVETPKWLADKRRETPQL